ncbi:MAG TPA: M55 family metallopeptidase [Candidatus Syntrophosphaera sp.]|mgnify:CR=1 FL=1|jgi:D-amino peptidase|nr:M55 family metallopeptidase [Candidatus Syntrophosphaera sp.]
MKLYISLDMEGMPGTFNWDQEKTDRPAVRRCFTHHVESVLQSVLEHPSSKTIEEITIADSHSGGDNLDYSITALDKRISLISGTPRPYYMMPELAGDYDQAWLLGYHSGTGALRGNMDHTYSNSRIHNIWLNGQPMNEALINSAYAGCLGVPVGLVTGDETLKKELSAPMPWLQYVATKQAVAKFAAKNYSQLLVDELVKAAVDRALAKTKAELPLYTFPTPIKLKIEFSSTAMADQAQLLPHSKRLDGRTVEYSDDDYAVVFEAIDAMVYLASTAGM